MFFRLFLLGMLAVARLSFAGPLEPPFFHVSKEQPYHFSIGAVLFDQQGRIACHHFENIEGYGDFYILMRESMEDGETPLVTMHRGLWEEFGAIGKPIAFLGSLSGWQRDSGMLFEKTTLYIACQMKEWNPDYRDFDDPEAISIIEWLDPFELVHLMEQQGMRFNRVDMDESEIVRRALPYIQQTLSGLRR